MSCDANLLKQVPFFSLLDGEELQVLAAHVELCRFEPFEAIYRHGDPGGAAYVLLEGSVRVTIVDEDNQDVTLDEPARGDLFGFASLLDDEPHQSNAMALSPVTCVKIDQEDLRQLLVRKPEAGMDLLAVLGRYMHSTEKLIRARALRNPNEVIEEKASRGERVADAVARFGGSWGFIGIFGGVLLVYTGVNVVLGLRAWDPYPFILLNLFLSMLAAIQAPVIMMSQNRQDAKDRMRSQMDFDVNRKAEFEIRALSGKLNEVALRMDEIERLLRRQGRLKEE
jgi:CRP/FNR family cyclic AMP-dependent transcriptional regulator